MHTGLLGRRPAGRIHASRNLRRVVLLPPVDKQSDGVLRFRHASQIHSRPLCGRRSDFHGRIVRDHTLANVDMVRIEVIRYIAVLASPRFEGLKLALRLAHVAVKVVEVAQIAGFRTRIGVCRVKTLVVLDKDEDAMLSGLLEQMKMVFQKFCCRLREQDVDLALDCVERDLIMAGVWGENSDGRAGFESINCGLVCIWVDFVVCWEGFKRDVEPVVGIRNVLLQMLFCMRVQLLDRGGFFFRCFQTQREENKPTDSWEFCSGYAGHA